MRIGIDCRLWNETGVGRYTRNLIKNLRALDNKNDYVLFANGSELENIKNQISNYSPEFKTKEIKNNKEWKVVKTDIRWHSIEEQIKFPRIINRENLDLVHFPYFSVPVFYNKPFVVTIHDLIIHNFPTGKASTLPYPIYKVKLFGYKYIISKIAKNAKKIIVPTNSVKGEVVKTLEVPKEKIEVTYEGVDDLLSSKFKVQSSKLQKISGRYFLYVGNAYPHKNLLRLIDAFIDLKKNQKYENISLLLVGRDDYFYKKLEKKIAKEDFIKVRHNISDNELSYLYKNAIALIIPSLMEGFGLTALEAMSNRCLVLASDIPALREVCQDTALYFNPYNTEEMKEIMKNVCFTGLNNQSKYKKEGFERSKMFSWQKMAEKTIKIYESCVSLRQSQ